MEYVPVVPPTGMNCLQYLRPYIENAGGYIWDANARDVCRYCPMRNTDQFLGPLFNIYYENHWRDFGLLLVFIAFNVSCISSINELVGLRTNDALRFHRLSAFMS